MKITKKYQRRFFLNHMVNHPSNMNVMMITLSLSNINIGAAANRNVHRLGFQPQAVEHF
jgi:hypothetical protein